MTRNNAIAFSVLCVATMAMFTIVTVTAMKLGTR